jgi:hypothetical protein
MELQNIRESVESGSLQVADMVNSIIGNNSQEIDDYINMVRHSFLNDSQILDGDLDKIILKIPVYIYYLTQVLQEIDIRKGISAENAQYVENETLINSTGTVAEKQAKAQNATVNNRVVQLAYKNAAGKIQAKINAAMEILNSAKRVQQRRLEEMKLTKAAGNAVGF